MMDVMFGFGAPEILILLVFGVTALLPVWGIIDAARRSEPAFTAAGQNKTLWIVLNAVGLFTCGLGAILAIVYLTVIRPKVAAAERGARI